MTTLTELLPDTFALVMPRHVDARGDFSKLFAREAWSAVGLQLDMRELFFTRSRRDTIRGMHFQRPPHAHAKLVACLSGAVQDVLVDLRRGPGFGRVASVDLRADQPVVLHVPEGVGHGFLARTDDALMLYATSREHAPSHDAGVLWSSIGHAWGCAAPLLSARDAAHPALAAFDTPF